MFYKLIFKQKVGAAPRYFHISFLFAFLEVFVRNIIITLRIYYTIVIIISINNNNAIISNNYGRLPRPYFAL